MYKSFVKEAKDYIQMNYDLFRLNLVEKLSVIISLILALFIGILLIIVAFVYFSIAFIFWTEPFFSSLIPGFLIWGGVFGLLFLVFYLLRKRIFVNPIIKILSKIIFNEPKKPTENEDE